MEKIMLYTDFSVSLATNHNAPLLHGRLFPIGNGAVPSNLISVLSMGHLVFLAPCSAKGNPGSRTPGYDK